MSKDKEVNCSNCQDRGWIIKRGESPNTLGACQECNKGELEPIDQLCFCGEWAVRGWACCAHHTHKDITGK